MSRTYKHQMLWELSNYQDDRPVVEYYGGPINPNLPQDLNDPHYQYYKYAWMGLEVPSRKWHQTNSHRQCRRKVKRLLQLEKWTEAKHIKPRDIAWEIW